MWQGQELNEWSTAIQSALAAEPTPTASAPPAFSLGDRATTTGLLAAAGFDSIDFMEVHEPAFYGPSIDAALEAIVALFLAKDAREESVGNDETLHRLRALLQAHSTADGVFFDSRAWIVAARRNP